MTAHSSFDMQGKTVIVTGAGRGLGRALALGFAEAGARLVVAGRTGADIDAVTREISALGGEAMGFRFDAEDAAQCETLVSESVRRFGRLDAMIVNHGITLHRAAYDTEADEFRKVIDINLTSCFLCAREAGKAMRRQGDGGAIVLVSSNASFLAYDGLTAYGASKGGVDQLCRQLGGEWAPEGIRVNAIGPGYMNSHMRGVEAEYEEPTFKDKLMAKIPMRRRGEPDELVGAAIFFAAKASSYITGQYLAIDGGYSLI